MYDYKEPTYYESLKGLNSVLDLSAARCGQVGAFNCGIERALMWHQTGDEKYQTTAISMPTRYGKSDIMRMIALELVHRGIISAGVFVAPATLLRDQLHSGKKVKEMVNRYKISISPLVDNVRTHNQLTPLQNNSANLIFMTTQLMSNNIDAIKEHMLQRKSSGKKPFAVFIDETHTASENNEWGSCVKKLEDAGCLVFLFTATKDRGDGVIPAGFRVVKRNEFESRKYITEITGDSVHISAWKTIIGEHELVPDYEYTFKRAFAEPVPVLCKLNRFGIDFGYIE